MCKFCKRLSHIHETLPFIRVNVEALSHGKADISRFILLRKGQSIFVKVDLLRFRTVFEIRRRADTLAIRKRRQASQGDLPLQITEK